MEKMLFHDLLVTHLMARHHDKFSFVRRNKNEIKSEKKKEQISLSAFDPLSDDVRR